MYRSFTSSTEYHILYFVSHFGIFWGYESWTSSIHVYMYTCIMHNAEIIPIYFSTTVYVICHPPWKIDIIDHNQ